MKIVYISDSTEAAIDHIGLLPMSQMVSRTILLVLSHLRENSWVEKCSPSHGSLKMFSAGCWKDGKAISNPGLTGWQSVTSGLTGRLSTEVELVLSSKREAGTNHELAPSRVRPGVVMLGDGLNTGESNQGRGQQRHSGESHSKSARVGKVGQEGKWKTTWLKIRIIETKQEAQATDRMSMLVLCPTDSFNLLRLILDHFCTWSNVCVCVCLFLFFHQTLFYIRIIFLLEQNFSYQFLFFQNINRPFDFRHQKHFAPYLLPSGEKNCLERCRDLVQLIKMNLSFQLLLPYCATSHMESTLPGCVRVLPSPIRYNSVG